RRCRPADLAGHLGPRDRGPGRNRDERREEFEMTNPPVPFGIVALGHALGDPVPVAEAMSEYTADERRVKGWQYRGFHRAKSDIGVADPPRAAGAPAPEPGSPV